MKCKKCGAELQEGERYCICGEKSENYDKIVVHTEALKKIMIGAFLGLLGFAIVHLFMRDANMDESATITLVQLMRFFSLGLALGGVMGVGFCKYASIEYRLMTIFILLGMFATVWWFLFPPIPNSILCYELFHIG